MKNFTKLWGTIALMLVVGISTYAQNSVTTPDGTLYRHGLNGSGTAVATENTDSVTVGSKMDYFVMPDPLYNPSYNPATNLTSGLVSTFAWSTSPNTGVSIATKTGMMSNIITATWSATGLYTLSVLESAACAATSGRDIPVQVIAVPTANFSSATSTQCTTTPASQTFQLPLALTTEISSGTMEVDLRVVYTPVSGAPTTTNYNNRTINEGGTLNLETLIGSALAYGKYEITITAVRDRVSVKSKVPGSVGAQPTYTYNLIRVPQTGEIYHLPNI